MRGFLKPSPGTEGMLKRPLTGLMPQTPTPMETATLAPVSAGSSACRRR